MNSLSTMRHKLPRAMELNSEMDFFCLLMRTLMRDSLEKGGNAHLKGNDVPPSGEKVVLAPAVKTVVT